MRPRKECGLSHDKKERNASRIEKKGVITWEMDFVPENLWK